MRKSKNGIEIDVQSERSTLQVVTKVPTKYILIDSETGQVYRGNSAENKSKCGYDWWLQSPSDPNHVLNLISEIIKEE